MAALISFQIYPFMICVCIKPRRLDGNHMPTATENSVWVGNDGPRCCLEPNLAP